MLVELASNNSFWRGYNYYESKRVKDFKIIDRNTITGVVRGSQIKDYDVTLDLSRPRKSQCSCPFSSEHPNAVCKHMVAVYFTAFPDEAKRIMQEIEDEEERERKELVDSITEYVNSLSVKEVRQQLINRMIEEETEEDDDYCRWKY